MVGLLLPLHQQVTALAVVEQSEHDSRYDPPIEVSATGDRAVTAAAVAATTRTAARTAAAARRRPRRGAASVFGASIRGVASSIWIVRCFEAVRVKVGL